MRLRTIPGCGEFHFGNIVNSVNLMVFVTAATWFSYLPQIVKLLKTKSADDISVATLLLWVYLALPICCGQFWRGMC